MRSPSIYEEQLNHILKHVTIKNDTCYTIYQKEFKVYRQKAILFYTNALSEFGGNIIHRADEKYQLLIEELTSKLYWWFYCGVDKVEPTTTLPPKQECEYFMEQLSKANQSFRQFDRNWKVYEIDQDKQAYAQKNGELRIVYPKTYISHNQENPLAIGDLIDFYCFRESKTQQAVFYYIFGETFFDKNSHKMRIYWNIEPKGASTLIELISKLFNTYQVPFTFKCLNHPDLYIRNDSAVLYFDKDDLMIVHQIIKRVIPKIQSYLKIAVPLFTKKIANGVSIAEDPGGGKSFGNNHCKALAEALVAAFMNQLTGTKHNDFIYQYLLERGIDPKRMAFHPHTQHFLLDKW